MSKIKRYAGNLRAFGSNAQGLERTLFGETVQADDLTSQVTAAFLRGWGIVGPSENPSLEDFNAAMYALSQFIVYQHQMGIPEWDAAQEYYTGSLCVRGGETYSSLVDDNIGNVPPSAKWTPVLTSKNGLANLGLGDVGLFTKYGCPLIGQLVDWPLAQMPHEIWPDMKMEFIPYMGQTFDGTKYPLLAQLHPTLQLPADMRGQFVRGWDNGRGIDPTRALLSGQTDAIKTHNHTAIGMVYSYGWAANGPGKDYGNGTVTTSSTGGTETRPVNIAWNQIVRAK